VGVQVAIPVVSDLSVWKPTLHRDCPSRRGKINLKNSSIYEQYISESLITDGKFGMIRKILIGETGPSFLRHL